jgi:choline monooxygenase
MKSFFVDSDISIAKTIHSDFYKSEKALELAKEKIFAAGLQFVGDTDMLSENGSAFPIVLLEGFLDEPLVVLKDKEGNISCMSNVCTHRGNLLITAPCKLDNFRCKYHGRTFSLKGEMIFMPEFKEVKNFPCKDDHLQSIAFCFFKPFYQYL